MIQNLERLKLLLGGITLGGSERFLPHSSEVLADCSKDGFHAR